MFTVYEKNAIVIEARIEDLNRAFEHNHKALRDQQLAAQTTLYRAPFLAEPRLQMEPLSAVKQ